MFTSRRSWLVSLVLFAITASPLFATGRDLNEGRDDGGRETDHRGARVMTYNVDEGSDFQEVLGAVLSGNVPAI